MTNVPKTGLEEAEVQSEVAPEGINLRQLNANLHVDVLSLVANKRAEATSKLHPSLSAYPQNNLVVRLQNFIAEKAEVEQGDVIVTVPSDRKHADVTVKIPKLISSLGKEGYQDYIVNLCSELSAFEEVKSSEAVGIYINLRLNRHVLDVEVLNSVETLGADYGKSDHLSGKSFLVDFSSPNIAKTMHVGHLRSTVIGQALVNLVDAEGGITYSINHLGDWGTTFGQIITAYEYWGEEVAKEIDPDREPVKYLSRLYAMIKEKIKKTGEVEETEAEEEGEITSGGEITSEEAEWYAQQGRNNFILLERGVPSIVALWDKFRIWSLMEFQRVYDRLGIKFDAYLGESFYEDKMDEPISDVVGTNLVKFDNNGALVMSFDKKGNLVETPYSETGELLPGYTLNNEGNILTPDGKLLRTALLRKSGGASNYATRDVAAIRYRVQNFGADQILYVVGSEQRNHFNEVFEVSRMVGDIEEGQCRHIVFGMMKGEDNKKISSRKGAGGLEDLFDELVVEVEKRLVEKNPDADPAELRRNARIIGDGALIYSNFMQSIERDMIFDPESMLDLSNQSGPYIQYTFVRAKNLCEKTTATDEDISLQDIFTEEFEGKLPDVVRETMVLIADFPNVVANAAEKYKPNFIAEYLFEVCSRFNTWYSMTNKAGERLIDLPPKEQLAYKKITEATMRVIENGLKLLNIGLPSSM